MISYTGAKTVESKKFHKVIQSQVDQLFDGWDMTHLGFLCRKFVSDYTLMASLLQCSGKLCFSQPHLNAMFFMRNTS